MGFSVYNYRTDIRNILVTPQIRARFLKIEPGPMAEGHSHDLGHEIFLILQGKAEFEIDGERDTLEPGQMCVALTDQTHAVRAVGPEPVIMYLSVTPHIQPTHTMWDERGNRRPHRFVGSESYDTGIERSVTDDQVVDSYLYALAATAEAAQKAAAAGADVTRRLKTAMDEGDSGAIEEARNVLWDSVSPVYERVAEMADIWNDLAARSVEAGQIDH
jgi:quercetin dioxygenase-like cupin family protein